MFTVCSGFKFWAFVGVSSSGEQFWNAWLRGRKVTADGDHGAGEPESPVCSVRRKANSLQVLPGRGIRSTDEGEVLVQVAITGPVHLGKRRAERWVAADAITRIVCFTNNSALTRAAITISHAKRDLIVTSAGPNIPSEDLEAAPREAKGGSRAVIESDRGKSQFTSLRSGASKQQSCRERGQSRTRGIPARICSWLSGLSSDVPRTSTGKSCASARTNCRGRTSGFVAG